MLPAVLVLSLLNNTLLLLLRLLNSVQRQSWDWKSICKFCREAIKMVQVFKDNVYALQFFKLQNLHWFLHVRIFKDMRKTVYNVLMKIASCVMYDITSLKLNRLFCLILINSFGCQSIPGDLKFKGNRQVFRVIVTKFQNIFQPTFQVR